MHAHTSKSGSGPMVPMAPRAVRTFAATQGGAPGGRGCPGKGLDGAGDGEALNGPVTRGLLPRVIRPPPQIVSPWGMHSNLRPERCSFTHPRSSQWRSNSSQWELRIKRPPGPEKTFACIKSLAPIGSGMGDRGFPASGFHAHTPPSPRTASPPEAQVGNHPPEVAREVQKILYRNRCGVRLGAHNALDGEEAHNLFWAWEQIAPLLAYVEEDPTWQAVVALRTLLRTLYSPIPVVPRPSCRPVGAVFREHCCGESGSHYLLFLEEDCDAMLDSADACGVRLAAVSRDVVESVNYILKKGYNGHSARGWGVGKSVEEREAMVV